MTTIIKICLQRRKWYEIKWKLTKNADTLEKLTLQF